MDKMTAGGRLFEAAFSWDELPQRLGISPRTAARWRANGLPRDVAALLAAWSDLGTIHAAWRGWSINPRDGLLYAPNEETRTPGEVQAIFWYRQQIQGLQGDVRRLKHELQELEARAPRRDQRWRPARSTRRRSSSAHQLSKG